MPLDTYTRSNPYVLGILATLLFFSLSDLMKATRRAREDHGEMRPPHTYAAFSFVFLVYTFRYSSTSFTLLPSHQSPRFTFLPMPSPGPDDGAVAVCCMCGDHGMPQELFRCKLCRLRLQHMYVLHAACGLFASIDQFV